MIEGLEICAVPFEFKAVAGNAGAEGSVEGYGSVFGNVDSHGDVILPGAFSKSIEERKAQGRTLPMHVMHGIFGGDGIPAGVWHDVREDGKGLRVKGKISGVNTDAGQLLYQRVKDGALGGLSIGYSVPNGGSAKMSEPGGAKRQIKQANLFEVSLVDDPSNAQARVAELKRSGAREVKATLNATAAQTALAQALKIFQASLQGNDAPTAGERQQLLTHLQDAYEALTGNRMPEGMKAALSATSFKMPQELSEVLTKLSAVTGGSDPAPSNLLPPGLDGFCLS